MRRLLTLAVVLVIGLAGCARGPAPTGPTAPTPPGSATGSPTSTSSPAAQALDMTITFLVRAQIDQLPGTLESKIPGSGLSATGQNSARAAATVLAYANYDKLFTSPAKAAVDTGAAFTASGRLQPTTHDGFTEIRLGSFEQTTNVSGVRAVADKWLAGDPGARIPDGDTGTEFASRFRNAIQATYDAGGRNVLVVTHPLALYYWVAFVVPESKRPPLLGETGFVVMSGSQDDGWQVEQWNANTGGP